jgi:hypothetical protein
MKLEFDVHAMLCDNNFIAGADADAGAGAGADADADEYRGLDSSRDTEAKVEAIYYSCISQKFYQEEKNSYGMMKMKNGSRTGT